MNINRVLNINQVFDSINRNIDVMDAATDFHTLDYAMGLADGKARTLLDLELIDRDTFKEIIERINKTATKTVNRISKV